MRHPLYPFVRYTFGDLESFATAEIVGLSDDFIAPFGGNRFSGT
jgi:hypothetical protein